MQYKHTIAEFSKRMPSYKDILKKPPNRPKIVQLPSLASEKAKQSIPIPIRIQKRPLLSSPACSTFASSTIISNYDLQKAIEFGVSWGDLASGVSIDDLIREKQQSMNPLKQPELTEQTCELRHTSQIARLEEVADIATKPPKSSETFQESSLTSQAPLKEPELLEQPELPDPPKSLETFHEPPENFSESSQNLHLHLHLQEFPKEFPKSLETFQEESAESFPEILELQNTNPNRPLLSSPSEKPMLQTPSTTSSLTEEPTVVENTSSESVENKEQQLDEIYYKIVSDIFLYKTPSLLDLEDSILRNAKGLEYKTLIKISERVRRFVQKLHVVPKNVFAPLKTIKIEKGQRVVRYRSSLSCSPNLGRTYTSQVNRKHCYFVTNEVDIPILPKQEIVASLTPEPTMQVLIPTVPSTISIHTATESNASVVEDFEPYTYEEAVLERDRFASEATRISIKKLKYSNSLFKRFTSRAYKKWCQLDEVCNSMQYNVLGCSSELCNKYCYVINGEVKGEFLTQEEAQQFGKKLVSGMSFPFTVSVYPIPSFPGSPVVPEPPVESCNLQHTSQISTDEALPYRECFDKYKSAPAPTAQISSWPEYLIRGKDAEAQTEQEEQQTISEQQGKQETQPEEEEQDKSEEEQETPTSDFNLSLEFVSLLEDHMYQQTQVLNRIANQLEVIQNMTVVNRIARNVEEQEQEQEQLSLWEEIKDLFCFRKRRQ